jgi:predicted metal-dependent hydrolase
MLFLPMPSSFIINDLSVSIISKNIRHLNLRITPPHGEVVVSAPHYFPEEQVVRFIRSKMDWIRQHQERIRNTPWIEPKQYLSGEEHWYLGKKIPLEYHVRESKPKVFITGSRIIMIGRRRMGRLQRKALLQQGYKVELQRIVPELIRKYEERMGVSAAKVRYRSMKSRWGSCAVIKRNITLNTELAKKSPGAIESVVVHELAHLKERGHNKRFYQLMSEYFPEWRRYEEELKLIEN